MRASRSIVGKLALRTGCRGYRFNPFVRGESDAKHLPGTCFQTAEVCRLLAWFGGSGVSRNC